MEINIFNIPDDIFIHVIPLFLNYYSYLNLRSSHRIFHNLDLYYYNKKCNIIKTFFKKYMYESYADLRGFNRSGHLINLKTIMNNKLKYTNQIIQLISAFQYNFSYIETGSIVEGKLLLLHDAWVIKDEYHHKIHPFIRSFISKKSIRLINN